MNPLGTAEAQRLDGRVAVVTGAASGIGRSIARRLAASGAELVLVDVDEARLTKVALELCAEAVVADVASQLGVDRMFDRPRVDILVNNAGVLDALTPLVEVDDALWARFRALNECDYAAVKLANAKLHRLHEEAARHGVAVGL